MGWKWSIYSETMIKRNAISTFIFEYQGFEFINYQLNVKIGIFRYFMCKMGMGVVGGQGVAKKIRDHV